MTEMESKMLEVRADRNLSILHLVCQKKTSTTFFFFHGSMGNFRQFESLINHFSQFVNIVAYDALGCGASDKPEDSFWGGDSLYTSNNHIEDAVQVFELFRSEINVFIGHSFGSVVAARVFTTLSKHATESKSIAASILLGTFDAVPSARHPLFYLPVWILDLLQDFLSAQFAELAFSPHSSIELKEECRRMSNSNKMHVCKSFYSNFMWAEDDDWKVLSDVPVLICQGSDDLITPIEGAKRLFDKHFVKNQHSMFDIVERAGHQVMQENPQQVINVIHTFLSRIEVLSLDG